MFNLQKVASLVAFLLTVFILSCGPKKESCTVPNYLRFDNIPPDFKGILYISTFKVPFKYKVKQNRVIFPLTYVGFLSYKGTTLRVGRYKIDFFVPLWRVLKHRLVTSRCEKTVYRCFTYITSETNKGVKIYLTLDFKNRPIKGKICSMGSCYEVVYKAGEVQIKMDQVNLNFVLSPSQ